MKEFLETTIGKIILGVVVAAVWGINFVNFSELAGQNEQIAEPSISEISLEDLELPNAKIYTYWASGRDPFFSIAPVRQTSPEPVTRRNAPQQVYQPPVLFLTGIMDGLAVISSATGETHLVSKGEVFNGVSVLEVWQDSVLLQHQKNKITLTINN